MPEDTFYQIRAHLKKNKKKNKIKYLLRNCIGDEACTSLAYIKTWNKHLH